MADEATAQTQDDTVVVTEATEASTQPTTEAQQTEATAPVEQPTEESSLLGRAEVSTDDGADDKAAVEAPETYEPFKGDYLDEEANTEIAALAKEKSMTQEQANTLAEGYDFAVKSLLEANKQTIAENVKAFEADPAGKENALLAVKALDHLGIKEHFSQNGYDNDYTLIKALAKFGQMLSEDKVVTGATSGPGAPQSPYGEEWK